MRIPSNKVCDIERFIYQELRALYSHNEIRNFIFILFEHFLGWDTGRFLISRQNTINQSDLLKLNFAIKDLRNHKPIQYITGNTYFFGLTFFVNEATLIPRPETEELVNKISENKITHKSILDLCTGSGCIAISLAKTFPNATVFATDISEKALETASLNASQHHVKIAIKQADILQLEHPFANQIFDIIVSNPPYVRFSEKTIMEPNVLNYEPHIALFVDDKNPLLFYNAIGDFASQYLSENGSLYLEINEALGPETCLLFLEKGFNTQLFQDFRGKDRFIVATRK